MKHRFRIMLTAVVVAGGAATLAGAAGAGAAAAADEPPSLVEDYSYPGAAAIKERYKIDLFKGDGNIMLVDCLDRTDVIKVDSRRGYFCFKVTGPKGYLTMLVPQVPLIQGDDNHNVVATATVGGETLEPVEIAPGEWENVGVGEQVGQAALVELRVG